MSSSTRTPFAELHERKRLLAAMLRECAGAIERATTQQEVSYVAGMAHGSLETQRDEGVDLQLVTQDMERVADRLSYFNRSRAK